MSSKLGGVFYRMESFIKMRAAQFAFHQKRGPFRENGGKLTVLRFYDSVLIFRSDNGLPEPERRDKPTRCAEETEVEVSVHGA